MQKLNYLTPVIRMEFYDERDVLTESPSSYDGVGYIPENWYEGWNA